MAVVAVPAVVVVVAAVAVVVVVAAVAVAAVVAVAVSAEYTLGTFVVAGSAGTEGWRRWAAVWGAGLE